MFAPEPPAPGPGRLDLSIRPVRQPTHEAFVHGEAPALRSLDLALKYSLDIAAAGYYRFKVSGRLNCYIAWLCEYLDKERAEVMTMLRITEADVKTDGEPPAPVLYLPDRERTTKIERDADGVIAAVLQSEKTVIKG